MYILNSENILSPSPVGGAICLLLLFALSFVGVHIVRLANIGWKAQQPPASSTPSSSSAPAKNAAETEKSPQKTSAQTSQSSAPPAQPSAPPPPEPVYYIVEKKRKRPRDTYSAPKEIKFKRE